MKLITAVANFRKNLKEVDTVQVNVCEAQIIQ